MKTHLRDNATTSVDHIELDITTEVLGWFNNQYNRADGWVIVDLDEFERIMLEHANIDHSDVYRVMTDDRTSLCRINVERESYAFLDNAELMETGMYRFERLAKYTSLYIDSHNALLTRGK
ncbi:hypothetical protein VPHD482_0282 [Vibrio phage D482]